MFKSLIILPFMAFALIAAKPAPPPAKPVFSMNAPAEVAADPANRWTLELSNGGRVVIQLRPDVAPSHAKAKQPEHLAANREEQDGCDIACQVEQFGQCGRAGQSISS